MPFIRAGRIGRPHGLAGEVNVVCEAEGFDVLAGRPHWFVGFDSGSVLHVRVESARPKGSSRRRELVVALACARSRTEAARLSGASVYLPSNEVPEESVSAKDREARDDRFKTSDIKGFRVVDEKGSDLGTVDNCIEMPAQDLLVVIRPDGKEVLIPVTSEIVRHVGDEERKVTIRVVEGLLDL